MRQHDFATHEEANAFLEAHLGPAGAGGAALAQPAGVRAPGLSATDVAPWPLAAVEPAALRPPGGGYQRRRPRKIATLKVRPRRRPRRFGAGFRLRCTAPGMIMSL
jgi:hypothetical protein